MEEAHEVVDAIESGDSNLLRDELGDLLLNLAFQIVIGEEGRQFDREDVVRGLEQKMERRHPHLYGRGEAESWEALKHRERGGERPLATAAILGDLVPASEPLRHAHRLQERVARVGFDWPDAGGALEKVREEIEEVASEIGEREASRLEEEIGDLLFSVVNLARLAGVDSPLALARANAKFTRRFNALEMLAGERGVVLGEAGLDQLDVLWEEAKRQPE
jgi:nucleoside triphosphate diphosphatase